MIRKIKLSEVAEIIMGQSPPGNTYNEVGDGMPFFQGKAEFGETSPMVKKWCNEPKKIAEAGDILMSVRAPVGPTNLASERCCIGRGLAAIRANQAELDSGFLRFFLLYQEPYLAGIGQGSTFAAIGRSEIDSLKLQLPPLPEQRRLVDILSRAEGIVRLRREAQKKAQELIPALFLDMFGDPATNPKGWPVMALGELCSRITDGTHQPPKFQDSGIPFIFVSNIVQGELSFDTTKFISNKTHTELTRRCPIEINDVLYSTVGSYGVPVKVNTKRPFAFQRHIAHLKPFEDRLNSDFLVGMLATPALRAQADSAARGIAQKTINLSEIRKFKVIIPPLNKQRRFGNQIHGSHSIQSQQSIALQKAEATFQSLLHRAFAGEL